MMNIVRCLNCGNLILKRKRIGAFCCQKCKIENIEKQTHDNETIDLWENVLVKLDLSEREKSKDFRIMRR